VLGWAAVSSASDRCAYAGVVEHSVYVDPSAWGRGIGLALLRALLVSTDAGGVWKVRSELFPGRREAGRCTVERDSARSASGNASAQAARAMA
jgi:L-amino acid N-acyltransferase YncA